MRLGPELWDCLMDAFDNPDTTIMPMLLTVLFSQRTEKFNLIMQEIFGRTKAGKNIATKILNKTHSELEIDDFNELMLKKQTDVSVLSDDYFLPEEL